MERRPFDLHFRLGSVPIIVEPSFWIFTALLGWHDGVAPQVLVAWVAICFASIIVHELGHAALMLAFGSAAAVRLYSFGGLAMPDRQLGRWQGLAVSLAGPFAGFLLGAGVLVLAHLRPPDSEFGAECLWMAKWVNFGWGMMNLMPVLPLDGGHVLGALLGPTRRRATAIVSLAACAAVIGLGLWAQMTYVVLLFAFFGARNFQLLMADRPIRAQKPPQGVPDVLPQGWAALRAGDEHEAARLAHLAVSGATSQESLNAARDLLAWVSLAEGEPRAALRQLEQIVPPQAARGFSLAMVYDVLGLPERAVEPALRGVAEERSDPSASLAVRLLLASGRVEEAAALVAQHAWTGTLAKAAAEASVLLTRKDYLGAAERFGAAFDTGKRPEHAVGAARAHAGAGQVERAAQWLEQALGAGLEGLDELAADPSLSGAVTQLRASRPAA